MRDGFERTKPKLVHLEATTIRSRDIYAHYGFEVRLLDLLYRPYQVTIYPCGQVDEERQFGRGAVDARGIAAKGSAATGYPEWIMTKVWTQNVPLDDLLAQPDSQWNYT